jgi:hypothetical protein
MKSPTILLSTLANLRGEKVEGFLSLFTFFYSFCTLVLCRNKSIRDLKVNWKGSEHYFSCFHTFTLGMRFIKDMIAWWASRLIYQKKKNREIRKILEGEKSDTERHNNKSLSLSLFLSLSLSLSLSLHYLEEYSLATKFLTYQLSRRVRKIMVPSIPNKKK